MTDIEIDDGNRHRSPDEMLDKICWMIANEANSEYPADGTDAASYTKSLIEGDSDIPLEKKMLIYTELVAEKNNTIITSQMIFEHLQSCGFDPVRRAHRETLECREKGIKTPLLDWGWLEESSAFPDNIQINDNEKQRQ